MKKKRYGKQGVISVLVSLMLAGILSVGTLVIESGRFQAAKTQLIDANISAGTSMIASYNSTLFDRYGLLAIDNETFTTGRYMDYLAFNSDLSAGFDGNNISTFYQIDSVEIEGLLNLTYPEVLKRQILSRAKYNIIPQDYSLNYYNMDYFLADLQSKASFISNSLYNVANGNAVSGEVPAEMQVALEKLYQTFSPIKKYDEDYDVTLSAGTTSLLPSVTGTVEHSVSTEDVSAIDSTIIDAQTILGSSGSLLSSTGAITYNEIDVTLDISFISNVFSKLETADSISANAQSIASDCRTMIQGINAAINMLNSDKEGNLLLNSYIAGYFSNKNLAIEGYMGPASGTSIHGSMDNATFSGACVEYFFSGDASEKVNQESAYNYIMAIRLISNLYSVINNSDFFNSDNAGSVAAHIAWAYYETFADLELLFKYNAIVPFGKYNMILPINNPTVVENAFALTNLVTAMRSLGILTDEDNFVISGVDETDYRDALSLALWFVPNSKKMLRVADMVQLEMRYREQYVDNKTASFLMSEQNTFCRVKCIGKLNSILPVVSLGNNSGIKGTRFQSIKYVGY